MLLDHVRSRYGAPNLLVNNAGMTPRERRDILESEEAGFDELLATNLKGPHLRPVPAGAQRHLPR
jgi:NAD(P)-dependent dehydrogenase (short-subunit alcohol dehydrogenase family)